LASAKPGQPRLSIGLSRSERSAAPPPPPPQMATLQQQLNEARLAKKGNPMKWVTISAVVIALGVAGFLFRRSIITIFMSIELMLNAVNLSFVTFSYQNKSINGHLFAFFVMVVAAAEAAVGLAIILTIFKNRQTLNIDDIESMKN
jgi:NADH-quinone oxidoreductase subunit K